MEQPDRQTPGCQPAEDAVAQRADRRGPNCQAPCTRPSLPSVEADFPVGVVCDVVVVVVDAAVVVAAEQAAVVQVGGSALGPGDVVVGVGHRWWAVAVDGGAALVAQGHRDALGLGVEAALPADVEDFGLPAEYGRDEVGGAGEAAGLAAVMLSAGVQGGRPRLRSSCRGAVPGSW